MPTPAIAALAAIAFTTALLPLVISLLRRRNVLDRPNQRSSHIVAVPRGAGLALAGGMGLALLVTGSGSPVAWLAVLGFTGIGAWDDLRIISVRARLAVQLGLSVAATALLVAEAGAAFAWVIVGALVVVATVNAVNFMDGINGISGLHALLWGAVFAYLLRSGPLDSLVPVAVALAGAAAAFLPWNAWRPRAFLGDAGSYLIGGTVGLFAVGVAISGHPVAALCPLAVYATDTGATVIRRARRGEPLGEAHRDHTYQSLLGLGWSHLRTATVVLAFSAVCSAAGLLAFDRPWQMQSLSVAVVVATCATYVGLPRVLGRHTAPTPVGAK